MEATSGNASVVESPGAKTDVGSRVQSDDVVPKKPLHIRLAAPCFACRTAASFFLSVKQAGEALGAAGINLSVDLIGNESLVQRARNVLVERFLRSDADKLFFVDSDIIFDPQDFLRVATNPKDVVTGAYAKKDIRWEAVEQGVLEGRSEPVCSMGLNYNVNVSPGVQTDPDGTFPVLDAATGFMCLSRRVLQRLRDEFRDTLLVNNDLPHTGDDNERIEQYVAMFDCMIDPESRRYLSEDYALCRRLQQIKETVWLDFRCRMSHVGTAEYHGDAKLVWETLRSARERARGPGKPTQGKPPLPPKAAPQSNNDTGRPVGGGQAEAMSTQVAVAA